MPFFFPPEPIAVSDVLDIDDINVNVQAFHSEVQGELNEHNFVRDCLADMIPNLAPDFCMRAHIRQSARDPHLTASLPVIAHSRHWLPIEDADVSFNSRGGEHYIIASWGVDADEDTLDRPPGKMYAIEIDGSVYPESLLGSGDISGDYQQATLFDGATLPDPDWPYAPAWRGPHRPFAIEFTAKLAPGFHTVRLVARSLQLSSDVADDSRVVQSVEIIVLELW